MLRQAYDKMYFATRARGATRAILDIANGYDSGRSEVIPDKVGYLNQSLEYGLNGILRVQQFLETAEF